MKKLLTFAFLAMTVNAFADSTVINPTQQIYSSSTPRVINASKYRTKTVVVNGITTTGLFGIYTGSVSVKCGATQTGPFPSTTVSAITANGFSTWSDACTWVQVTYTKTKKNVQVWLMGNPY
jgi:hypothetical protein